jgi:DNA polymerase III alpha subunit
MVARFSGYGYCKAHAMTYAYISYREAYLKLRYPAAYMAAVCSGEAGYYHVSVYVEEAKRLGVRVLLPDINKSQWLYTVEKGAMRVGFMQVKNLPRETVNAIIVAREADGFFTSLGDFLARVPIDKAHLESLIKCGAFDAFENTRPELLWKLKLLDKERERRVAEGVLIAAEPLWTIVPHVPDYDATKKYHMEYEILDVSVRCHPTELLRPTPGTVPSREFAKHTGKVIKTIGWIVAYRRTTTKDRKEMLFLTCEDRSGIYEAILWPEVCSRDGDVMHRSRMVEITGTVESHGQIVASKVTPWKK